MADVRQQSDDEVQRNDGEYIDGEQAARDVFASDDSTIGVRDAAVVNEHDEKTDHNVGRHHLYARRVSKKKKTDNDDDDDERLLKFCTVS